MGNGAHMACMHAWASSPCAACAPPACYRALCLTCVHPRLQLGVLEDVSHYCVPSPAQRLICQATNVRHLAGIRVTARKIEGGGTETGVNRMRHGGRGGGGSKEGRQEE